jgi:hypothetical protein
MERMASWWLRHSSRSLIRVRTSFLYFNRRRQGKARHAPRTTTPKLSLCVLARFREMSALALEKVSQSTKAHSSGRRLVGSASALMPNSDEVAQETGKACLTYTPAGPGTYQSISSPSLQSPKAFAEKVPNKKKCHRIRGAHDWTVFPSIR